MQPDQTNVHFDTALQYVNFTSRNIYLTGKAGTGKTTFLRYIKENSFKKLTVVAPTGIAAINAGGVTIHSLFQLPFGPFVPTRQNTTDYSLKGISNQQSVFHHMRFHQEKRRLLEELELLVIDEVSMVRADVLDAMDTILRSFRKQPNTPFGGVQVLFIGDLYQLPPVVNDEDWKTLSEFYKSPFFFDSHALKDNPPLYLELKKIYRQSDQEFIDILNNVRDNRIQQSDLDFLNKFYKQNFKPAENEEYITLTTHNSKADAINQRELKKLSGKLHSFDAITDGNFDDRSYPADFTLNLKVGAQIMFIRNDKGEQRRYYNGKLGRISRIEDEQIYIELKDGGEELLLERETWKKVKYHFNKESDKIEEETTGSFTQFPIRLAWAITIHKSQGLTFDKAIIDASDSFTAGQVYVALSRLTSLDGLVLSSKIHSDCISSDKQIQNFSESERDIDLLNKNLEKEQKEFLNRSLINVFDWKKIVSEAEDFLNDFEERKIPQQEDAQKLFTELFSRIKKQKETADKFCNQLNKILLSVSDDKYTTIAERTEAGVNFFKEALKNELFNPIQEHYEDMKLRARTKKYLKEVQDFSLSLKRKKYQLEQSVLLAKGLAEGVEIRSLMEHLKPKTDSNFSMVDTNNFKAKKVKAVKGESHRASLKLFKEGKSIEEIAAARSMAIGTIEGHLISFIPAGEIEIEELVNPGKIEIIQKAIEESGDTSSSVIKEKLGDDFSYGDIKAVIAYLKKEKEAEV